jgi:peptidoglycan/LPS O-acetylase OafA/YrhL
VALLMSCSVVYVAFAEKTAGIRWLERRAVTSIGRVTYAGYVFHIYAIVVAWSVVKPILGNTSASAAVVRFLIALPLTLLLARASKWLVEDRVARFKKRFERGAPATESVRAS